MLDKTAVAFIFSALYMLTAWLMYLLIHGKRKNSICLFVGINLSLWMFVPEPGQDIFWWTGVVNYLLPMPLILGMLLIYQRGCDLKFLYGAGLLFSN